MGQCHPCANSSKDRVNTTDLRYSDTSVTSPSSTPNTNRLRRRKNEILMSDLVQEYNDYEKISPKLQPNEEGYTGEKEEDLKELQKLYSSEIDFENFEVIKVIGRGSYAKVYLIRQGEAGPLAQFYALKVLKKKSLHDRKLLHHTLQERKVLLGVNHPFVVSLHYAFQSPERIFFVLDYANGGELFSHLRKKVRLTEKETRIYAAELVLALDHLHEMGFIYRDIKPENILLDSEGHLKITDFGLSKAVGNQGTDQTNTLCGTTQYLAPEVILKKGYNKMVDWWGLGILIHEMAVGVPPFNNRSNLVTMNDIVHEQFEAKDWLSNNLQNLLFLLLDKNPKTRLGSPQSGGVNAIKSHPFFENIDWTKVLNREYPAPIKPKVRGRGDTKHISKLFLSQDIKNTPTHTTIDLELLKEMHFENFTYIGDQLNVVEDPEKIYDDKDNKVSQDKSRSASVNNISFDQPPAQ